jgi:phosphatidylglycerophosphatase A
MATGTFKPDWAYVRQHPLRLIAFGFGAGLARKAPGTWGTLVAFPLYLGLSFWLPGIFIFALIPLLFVLGVYASNRVIAETGLQDPSAVVWDEIVAFMAVLAWLPESLTAWLFGFALFRLFDITKPFPIRHLERRIKGGLGVMLDDLLAAIYTLVSYQFLHGLWAEIFS